MVEEEEKEVVGKGRRGEVDGEEEREEAAAIEARTYERWHMCGYPTRYTQLAPVLRVMMNGCGGG